MSNLKAASLEMVAYYRKNAAEFCQIADVLSVPRFSPDLIDELCGLLGGNDNVKLFEAISRMGNYHDAAEHADRRKRVSKLLKKRGVNLSRGKRTGPALEKLVSDLAPLLLYMGLPFASSERSHLVLVLQMVADTFNVPGDPRDKLRAWIKRDRRLEKLEK